MPSNDLAILGAGQIVQQVHQSWPFVAGQVLFCKVKKVVLGSLCFRRENNTDGDQCPVVGYPLADRHTVTHRRMVFHDVFDLVRRDPVTETVDNVVLSSQEPDISFLIPPREVTGQKPPVPPGDAVFLSRLPIAQTQAGVIGGYADHALGVSRHGLQFGVQNLDVMPRLRAPNRAGADRINDILGNVVRTFGHPQRLVYGLSEAVIPGRQHPVRQMLPGAHAMAQCRNVPGAEIGLLQDLAEDGRHADEDSAVVFSN